MLHQLLISIINASTLYGTAGSVPEDFQSSTLNGVKVEYITGPKVNEQGTQFVNTLDELIARSTGEEKANYEDERRKLLRTLQNPDQTSNGVRVDYIKDPKQVFADHVKICITLEKLIETSIGATEW